MRSVQSAATPSQSITALRAENAALQTQLQSLKAQLDWFRSPLFGAKSEQRLVPAPALQADTLAASGGAYPEAPSPATELLGALQCISQHAASKAVDLTPRVWKEKYADNVLKCDVDRVGE